MPPSSVTSSSMEQSYWSEKPIDSLSGAGEEDGERAGAGEEDGERAGAGEEDGERAGSGASAAQYSS